MKSRKGKSGKKEAWMDNDPRFKKIDRNKLVAKYGVYFIDFMARQPAEDIIKWLNKDEDMDIDIDKIVGLSALKRILTGQIT